MGTITRTFTNNIGASGVLGSSAFNNSSLNSVTSIPGAVTMKLLSTATLSGDTNVSFTTGLDSTYDEYWFVFNNIHPSNNSTRVMFNGSSDGGSNYNVTKTTTMYQAYHNEAGTDANLVYETGTDAAQSTGFDYLGGDIGNGNDQSTSGIFKLFNPSSTTYVKHFTSDFSTAAGSSNTYCVRHQKSGYFNTTSAVDAMRFQMVSGTMDGGTIKLYGVS